MLQRTYAIPAQGAGHFELMGAIEASGAMRLGVPEAILNTGKDSANDHGQWRGGDFRTSFVGGNWDDGAEAGARCVDVNNNPWNVNSNAGLRAACDSL